MRTFDDEFRPDLLRPIPLGTFTAKLRDVRRERLNVQLTPLLDVDDVANLPLDIEMKVHLAG